MKPFLVEERNGVTLQNLGRASLQIVHDIKNQLNGLKLYATFLRKRLEKAEHSDEERETVAKIISGLDRAAGDLSVLVQYGRPLELHRQSHIDLQKLIRGILSSLPQAEFYLETEQSLIGDFDPTALTDALRAISLGASKGMSTDGLKVTLRLDNGAASPAANIEWSGVRFDSDPFHSFRGSEAIRMSLAAKIVEAHGGAAEHEGSLLRVRLPLTNQNDQIKSPPANTRGEEN